MALHQWQEKQSSLHGLERLVFAHGLSVGVTSSTCLQDFGSSDMLIAKCCSHGMQFFFILPELQYLDYRQLWKMER